MKGAAGVLSVSGILEKLIIGLIIPAGRTSLMRVDPRKMPISALRGSRIENPESDSFASKSGENERSVLASKLGSSHLDSSTSRMGRRESLTPAEKALQDQSNFLPKRQLIFCLAIVSISQLISYMDQNGISTALPTIAADLDARNSISWAGTTSLLANTAFQMLYGRLSDIFGRKAIFISAILLLALGDLVCSLSTNAAMFYVFRGVAGIGSGGITNLAMIITSDVVSLEQRGKYQGIIGSMIGLGSVTGPFIASAFVERATWRGFFWLLAPMGVLNALSAFFFLPSKPPVTTLKEGLKKVDYLGVLTSSIGTIFLLIPISGGGSYFPWSSPMVISMLAIGGVFIILFVLVEWKFAKIPMMPGQFNSPEQKCFN